MYSISQNKPVTPCSWKTICYLSGPQRSTMTWDAISVFGLRIETVEMHRQKHIVHIFFARVTFQNVIKIHNLSMNKGRAYQESCILHSILFGKLVLP